MAGYLAPKLPPDKEFIYLAHSDTFREVDWVENQLLQPLEKAGFKCVFKERDFQTGRLDVSNINDFFRKSWKFVFAVSPDYINLIEYASQAALELGMIVGTYSTDTSKVVCLVMTDCDVPPLLTLFERISVKNDKRWLKKLLKALGAKDPSNVKETSFRHCSICETDFQQDFRQFQCFICKKVGCLDCCKYMAPVPPNFMRVEQVCKDCFDREDPRRQLMSSNLPVFSADEPEAISDPNAERFGFIILLHYGYGGIFKQINSTKSTPKYCDICKRTDSDGMALSQCKICYEIGCRTCIKYRAHLTSLQIAMGTACFRCFQQRNMPGANCLRTPCPVSVR